MCNPIPTIQYDNNIQFVNTEEWRNPVSVGGVGDFLFEIITLQQRSQECPSELQWDHKFHLSKEVCFNI